MRLDVIQRHLQLRRQLLGRPDVAAPDAEVGRAKLEDPEAEIGLFC